MQAPTSPRRPEKWAVSLFLLVALALAVAAWILTRNLQREALDDSYQALTAVGQLKARLIVAWRTERAGEAEKVAAWMGRGLIARWLATPSDAGLRSQAQEFLEGVRGTLRYADARLATPEGRVLLSSGQADADLEPAALAAVRKVVSSRHVTLSDVYRCRAGNLHLDIVAPVPDRDGRVAAVLLGRTDPAETLYPLVGPWPTARRTGETFLLAKLPGTRGMTLLSPLRFRPDLTPPCPLPAPPSPIRKPNLSAPVTGRLQGPDYRAAEVLGDLRIIPDSDWVLISQVTFDEALADARSRQRLVVGLVVLTALFVGALLWAASRRRQRDMYKALYEAEVRVRALRGHFDYVIRYAHDALFLSDDSGRIIEANDRAVELYGYSAEELRTLSLKQLRAASDRAEVERRIRAAGDARGVVFECRHVRRDGTEFPVEVSARRIEIEGRWFYHEIVRDVTERHRAEAAVHDAEARYRALVETANDGIFVHLDGRFAYLNPAALRLFGAESADQLLGTSILDRLHPDYRGLVSQQMLGLDPQAGDVLRQEDRHLRLDGTPFWTEVSAVPIPYQGRKGVVVFIRDVSERKQLEASLRQAQRMEAIGRLAGGIAHDFNNLLTVVNNYVEFCLERALEEGLRADLEQIAKAGARAAQLTHQLLAFSRRQVLQPRVVNVNDVVNGLAPMLRRVIGEDIDLATVLDAQLANVSADVGQLEQVLMNLVVNARDAMPQGGRLTIETATAALDEHYAVEHGGVAPGRYVRLSVSDTGHGMDDETRARIFDPFFTTKAPGQGTGLGLSTVYGIVRQSGGHVWVYSEPGRGATFKIYLPATESEVVEPADEVAQALRGGNETILVVEDERSVRDLVCRILTEAGYQVVTAPNGQSALAASASHQGSIHLLLTDVVMPDMSGREVARTLVGVRPEMKILFMSGYAENSIVHQGVLEPGTHFIGKPFTMLELARKVREVLDAEAGPPSGEPARLF